MSVQKYPLLLSIYKGEGRILIIPIINHIGGYSIDSSWFINIEDIGDYSNIGESIFKAIDFVKNSPVSSLTPKERDLEVAWKKNSKYKNWISFWKNNSFAHFMFFMDGHYEVYSMKRSEKRKGGYGDSIKEISLLSTATAEEIGEAVIGVFRASEDYYQVPAKQNATQVLK